jgi:hypothetical protein
MKSLVGAVVVVLSLAGGSIAVAAPGGFTFSVPPGWVNLSPDAPEAERQKASPELLSKAREGGFAFFAIDLDHGDDGYAENVNAVIREGARPPLATVALLDELEPLIQAEVSKQGMSYRALKKEVVKIAGVTAGRMVGELRGPGLFTKMVQYTIPGKLSHATLTFSTTPEAFARYEPIFDSAAQATRGAVEPQSRWASIWDGASRNAIIGGIAGGVIAVVGAAAKRKKKKAA